MPTGEADVIRCQVGCETGVRTRIIEIIPRSRGIGAAIVAYPY
jgi:hypothetical protein